MRLLFWKKKDEWPFWTEWSNKRYAEITSELREKRDTYLLDWVRENYLNGSQNSSGTVALKTANPPNTASQINCGITYNFDVIDRATNFIQNKISELYKK